MLGAPERERWLLAFFRGDMGQQRSAQYSRGIRQQLHALAKGQDWFGNYNISVGGYEETTGPYSELLALSVFCLVLPGHMPSPIDAACLSSCCGCKARIYCIGITSKSRRESITRKQCCQATPHGSGSQVCICATISPHQNQFKTLMDAHTIWTELYHLVRGTR